MRNWEEKVAVVQKLKGSCINQEIPCGIQVAPDFEQPVDEAEVKWEEKQQEEEMVVVWQA